MPETASGLFVYSARTEIFEIYMNESTAENKARLTLGIDIGSTTVKVAILDEQRNILFSDYERHFANIQETLARLLEKAEKVLGPVQLIPMITGSGGLTLAKHLKVTFVQEVVIVPEGIPKARTLIFFDTAPEKGIFPRTHEFPIFAVPAASRHGVEAKTVHRLMGKTIGNPSLDGFHVHAHQTFSTEVID